VRRVADSLFLATAFCVTFEKVHWSLGGDVGIADVLTLLFLVAFAASHPPRRVPRAAVAVGGFFAAFLLVYLFGFYSLDTSQALAQYAKGMLKFVVHFAFLVAGVVYLARRGERFYWRALAAFCGGLVVNALYGIAQLVAAQAGRNLDQSVLAPLTGGASSINVYGAIEGADVFRPNALTGDPNHLGIMLIVPLLVLAPLYLRLERGHRLRAPLAATLAFLLLMELATLSRSGVLGLGVGFLVLAVPYRHRLVSGAALVPLGAVAAVIAAVIAQRKDFFSTVLRSRVATNDASSSVHFDVYGFIPDVVSSHPLFGLGLNNFSVYYEFVTGKTNWGPHSFYVALFVETGLLGAAVFGLFVWWLFRRLRVARALGRALAVAGDARARRVRPLAWGFTAALAGTLASNAFYLTLPFYYFYAFAALALAIPYVFAQRALR
jgi:O-antigen ligase